MHSGKHVRGFTPCVHVFLKNIFAYALLLVKEHLGLESLTIELDS
jgi:hypothetical protein